MSGPSELHFDVFDALDQGFCTIEVLFDGDGVAVDYRFLHVNDAFEQQTGLRHVEGRLMRELVPAHEEHWFQKYGEIARTGVPQHFEHQAAALHRWYDVYAFRIGDPALRQVAVLFRDITDRKNADHALRAAREESDRANRVKDDFLAMLSHELRTPLAPMLTAVQLLKLRGATGVELDILERQLKHLNRLVDDLMDVSRISSGKIDLQLQRLNVCDVIVNAIELAGPRVTQHFVDLQVSRDGPIVEADSGRLAQVFANLLANAAKYSDPGSRIVVAAETDRDHVRISIKDEGIGLSAEALESVFEPFVQQPEGRERALGGLGLGLAIVRDLVRAHHGTVTARSAGHGRGSEFIVELPRPR